MAAMPVVAGMAFVLTLLVSWIFRGEEIRHLRSRLKLQEQREAATVGHLQGEVKRLCEKVARLGGEHTVRAMNAPLGRKSA